MSDEVTITSGTVTEVDSGALRDALSRLRTESAHTSDAIHSVQNAAAAIASGHLSSFGVQRIYGRLDALRSLLQSVIENGGYMADIYEVAELKATMKATPPGPKFDAMQGRLDILFERRPGLESVADGMIRDSELGNYSGLGAPTLFSVLAGTVLGPFAGNPQWHARWLKKTIDSKDFGWMAYGERLKPKPSSVVVMRSVEEFEDTFPTRLEDITDRFEEMGSSQISVEKRTQTDGSSHTYLYIKGTVEPMPQAGGSEPFNMDANLEMYLGQTESDSYHAVIRALEASGIEKGSTISIAATSQGAIIAAAIEASGDYIVERSLLFGTPMRVAGSDTQQITLLNTNDLVGNLAQPRPDGYGGPDSFDITRENAGTGKKFWEINPFPQIDAHSMDAYRETAKLADESGDVRVEAYHDDMRERSKGKLDFRHDYQAILPQ